MAASNHRIKDYNTVHHLTSRIAHKVFFLNDEARNDFLSFVFRVTEFTGLDLLGWCVMTNHFHLLVHLPEPEEISDEEVRRRYDVLKGDGRATRVLLEAEDVAAQRKRMYNVGNYMKMIKQWFSEDYNQRNGHKGTMWEAVYYDVPVPLKSHDMAERLAYMHLNPVRAAITPEFAVYPWSSLTSFVKGDARAGRGMRFVYGDAMTDEELMAYHTDIMRSLLEKWKLRRAVEIARKRAAGIEMPADPLTSEAMIAQATTHLAQVQEAYVMLQEAREGTANRNEARKLAESQIEALLQEAGELTLAEIVKRVGLAQRTAYRCVNALSKRGVVEKGGRAATWRLVAKEGLT